MLDRFFSWLGIRTRERRSGSRVRYLAGRGATYDAAQTTDENSRHWARADNLAARAAQSPEVRATLRMRARYESANNSYCRGMVATSANDLIGTGPRLQVTGAELDVASRVEAAFTNWAKAISLAPKLRTLAQAKKVDGEGLAVLTTNPAIRSSVQLDLRVLECDRLETPAVRTTDRTVSNGIRFDESGNPVSYFLASEHPGDTTGGAYWTEYKETPAAQVLHWFRADRPEQVRGVPEITPALPLFAQLRRFTLATLTAAETAANFAAVLESTAPADTGDGLDPFDVLEIERGMMTQLPDGAKLAQLKAEHPTTTYDTFKRELLNEIARALGMPYNVAAGNSSGYNYASGRLDHQVYHRTLRVERSHCESIVLDPLFRAFLDEAVMVPQLLPPGVSAESISWRWFWDGFKHVDPVKEAGADAKRLESQTTTLAEVYAEQGLDWEEQLRQRARELELMRELGLTVEPANNGEPAQ